MENGVKQRIFYFDALRALAILCVIILHEFAANIWLVQFDYGTIPSLNWTVTTFAIVCLRIGVDLFLMLSGALSLGRDWTIRSFLGRRLPRIGLPFLFWGFVLSLWLIFMAHTFNLEYIISSFDLQSIINFIIGAYLGESPGFYQYWFFWMILGTYLIMPIFNKWISHADLGELEYFLVFWLITCIFDFTLGFKFLVKLNYFVSPIGLVVLGYYLRYTERKFLNDPYISLILIIVPCFIMMMISYMLSSTEEIYVFDRYCIFTAIEVIGIFTLFKNFNKLNIELSFLKNPNGIIRKFISYLAKYSYGIYLTHIAFSAVLLGVLPYDLWGFKLIMLILILAVLFVPFTLIHFLNKIPYINQLIGAK